MTAGPINRPFRPHRVEIRNKTFKMNNVQFYPPTNDTTDATKEELYNQLHDHEHFTGMHACINLIVGDFNAKMGSDNQ